jgi:hypothetical protein
MDKEKLTVVEQRYLTGLLQKVELNMFMLNGVLIDIILNML